MNLGISTTSHSEERWLSTVQFSTQNQRPYRPYEELICYSLSRSPYVNAQVEFIKTFLITVYDPPVPCTKFVFYG